MKKSYLYLYVLFCLVALSCNQTKSQDGLTNVEPEQLQSYISNDTVQLIDVRTPKEFIEGHINQAINIDYYSENFFKQISKLNTRKPVYIYCRSGKRSGESVELFQKAGFTQIYNLDSGILGWISADLPITSDN